MTQTINSAPTAADHFEDRGSCLQVCGLTILAGGHPRRCAFYRQGSASGGRAERAGDKKTYPHRRERERDGGWLAPVPSVSFQTFQLDACLEQMEEES